MNTFSPEGRLFQVEYALEAIKLGTTAIGIKCESAVVLAVEKRITSSLLEPSSVEKLYEVDSHIGCTVSGLTPDARTMIEHARAEAQAHRFSFNEPMPVESVARAACDLALRFGEGVKGQKPLMSRPFGVALLLGGVDETGAHLFHADPSGTYIEWSAKAIGAGAEAAQEELERAYSPVLADAEKHAIRILSRVMEEKITSDNIQMARISADSFHLYSEADIKALMEHI